MRYGPIGPLSEGRIIQHSLMKNALWNSVGLGVYLVCQWVITVAVVRLTGGYTDAGYLALAMTVTNVFWCVAAYSIRAFQVSDIHGEYTDSTYFSARLVTCVAALLLCVVCAAAAGYSAHQIAVIAGYMVFRANEAFIDVLHGMDQKDWRMDYIGISFILRGVAMLAVFVVLQWAWGLLPAIAGMVAVTMLIGLCFDLVKTRKLASFAAHLPRNPEWSLLRACWPLAAVGILNALLMPYSRHAIEKTLGTVQLGAYSSVAAPALIIQAGVTFMMSPLINVFSEHVKSGAWQRFNRLVLLCAGCVLGMTTVIAVVAHLWGEWILILVFGDTIRPYAYLFSGAVVVSGLTAGIWLLNIVFTTLRCLRDVLIGNAIGIAVCLLTATWLLTKQGLMGANTTLILSQGVAMVFLLGRYFDVYLKRRRNQTVAADEAGSAN